MSKPFSVSVSGITIAALLCLAGGASGEVVTLASDLPEALRGGLAFWVDANRNVATDAGGAVTNWYDVREAAGGASYIRARQVGGELAPALVTGGDDVAGNRLVDFGPFPSGQWLEWQDASGSRYTVNYIRHVFMAISCTNGTGFLLGDATGSPGGSFCFHVGNSGSNGLESTWWQASGGGDDHPVRYGLTRVNGVMTDGMTQRVPHVGTVASIHTVGAAECGINALASNFCNDRNIRNGAWGVTPDRQGGGRIGEALIYTAELSDGQRRQVEDYLMRKWLRRPLEEVRVAAGDTLSMTVTNALDLSSVTGAGTLALAGAGRVALPDTANIAVPPLRLVAGGSASGTLSQRPGQPFVLQGGASYEAATGVCSRTALADAALAEKTGAGVLTVSSLDASVARIHVAEGSLRLAPPLPGAPGALTGALENGSFEDAPPGRPEEVGGGIVYMQNLTYAGWSYTFGQGGNCGLARYGGPFCNRQPDGTWVMFLCNDCAVSQNFTVPATGRYEVCFSTAAATVQAGYAGWPWHLYQVLVDGTNVVGSIRTSATALQKVTCRTPVLAAGTHSLTFLGFLEANRVSIVDDVKVRPCTEADEVEVPNGGFETPTVLTMKSSDDRPYANFETAPTNAVWTFAGTYAGTTEAYSTWRCEGMDEGGHAALLNIQDGGGLMSVPLTFPTAGVYRVTFKAASRTAHYNNLYNRWSDSAALNGNPVAVSLDGVEAARPTQSSWMGDFTAYDYVLPAVTNGALTQTLAFRALQTGWDWNTVLVDDVRVFRLPPLANPSFEDVSEAGVAWTFVRGAVECGITTPGEYSWTVTSPEGARCLIMANNGGVSQDVTLETSGTYELTFLAAQSPSTPPGHEFSITFGGLQVGAVRTMDTAFRRYAFRLPYAVAGQPYALVLQGLTPPGPWSASLIDSVMLRKVAAEPAPFSAQTFANAYVSLAADAGLELDFDGIIELDGLSCGGAPRTGTLSAANTPFIRGAGSVRIKPKGTVLQFR